MPATRPGPTASPTRSTRWLSPAPRCATRTCPSPSSTAPPGNYGSWSITAKNLVAERTRCINRLRWHLHELDPTWDPPARSLCRYKNLDAIAARLTGIDGPVARIAGEIAAHARDLTVRERALEREITVVVAELAPTLLALAGVGALTAAKLVAETADVRRFRSKDAYARHNGTAPLPVWSGNRERHRLSRTGNRQLNAAIHRIAITQVRCHDDAHTYVERRVAAGDTKTEALRALKRRLSDVVYRALIADTKPLNATTYVSPAGDAEAA
jgi:transposase